MHACIILIFNIVRQFAREDDMYLRRKVVRLLFLLDFLCFMDEEHLRIKLSPESRASELIKDMVFKAWTVKGVLAHRFEKGSARHAG